MINLGNGKYRDIEDIDEAFNKAKIYDDMQKPFTYRIYVPKLVKENKELKESVDRLAGHLDSATDRILEYKHILENLKDRYLNQNQKHFYELCDLYFDEDET